MLLSTLEVEQFYLQIDEEILEITQTKTSYQHFTEIFKH